MVIGIKLVQADDFEKWIFSIEVMGESLYKVRLISCGGQRLNAEHHYQDQSFLLQFRFDSQYPISAPAVQFVVDNTRKAPVHPVCATTLPSLSAKLTRCIAHLQQRSCTCSRLTSTRSMAHQPLSDLCLDIGQRVVARAERYGSLCDHAEHAGILQGVSQA